MSRFWVIVLLLVQSSVAAAFSISLDSGNELRWVDSVVSYELQRDGSDDIVDGSDLAAIRSAAYSWSSVACSALELSESALTSERATTVTTDSLDGINRFAWVEDSTWPYGSYVLGVATPVYEDGYIIESDITFNGYSVTWATDGEVGSNDIESVAVHEMGHVFGLQHILGGNNLGDPPTMSAIIDPWMRGRDLTDDDALGACYLYPRDGYPCDQDCDCPRVLEQNHLGQEFYVAQTLCAGSQCAGVGEVSAGTVGPGGACTGQVDCEEELLCASAGQYGAYCAELCELETIACAAGYDCWVYPGTESGACLPQGLETRGGNSVGACLAASRGGPSCLCDADSLCDSNCLCDADCSEEGCGCHGGSPLSVLWWLLVAGLGWVRLRRRCRVG